MLEERGGRLGCNVKVVLEMAEERGSTGLRDFIAAHAGELKADVLIASDGPRVEPGIPTIATGTRGTFHFDLVLKLRPGGVHSGHWGGLTRDPAILLAHALASMMDRNGKVLVRGILPKALSNSVRSVLDGCPVGGGDGAATIDEGWGEPGLSSAEKIYGWNSLIVLAMISGRPENRSMRWRRMPAPIARSATRWTATPRLRRGHPRASRRERLRGRRGGECRAAHAGLAHRSRPSLVRWAQASMQKSLGKKVQIIPNSSAACPGTCSWTICMCRWSGCRTATMAASSTGRTSIC